MFMIPDLKPEEVIMYLRKSRTDDPALTVSETVAKHEQMLDDYSMRTWSATIPEQNRFREIVSGETIEARPEIKKVLRLIEQERFKAILIVEPQRLSRGDLEDIGRLSKLLRYTKTFVITLQYTYDLSDERDRDYFERELKRGNEYLEYSKRIMMNGRNLSAEKGYYTGSLPPYGYAKVFKKEGNRKFPTLDIIPEEADIVRLIFRMYADGNGATNICNHLYSIGSVPNSGGNWRVHCIYTMLDNPVYNGKIKWGNRKTIKQVENGEIKMRRPRNYQCPVYDGKHEAIIDDELWNAVRYRRDKRDIPKVKASIEMKNPLSGLLYCVCGCAMVRRPYIGKSRERYQCQMQARCDNSSCTVDDMIEAVSDAIRETIADFEIKIQSGSAKSNEQKEENLRILKVRMEEIEKKESSLWEKYVEDKMPKDIFDSLLSKIEKQKQDISRMIDEAEQAENDIDYSERITTFSAAISAISDPSAPVAETNKLLKSCIKRITYSRERSVRSKGIWESSPMNLEIEFNI